MRPVSESLGRAQAESSSLRGLRHEVCGIFFLLGMLEHIVVTPVFVAANIIGREMGCGRQGVCACTRTPRTTTVTIRERETRVCTVRGGTSRKASSARPA